MRPRGLAWANWYLTSFLQALVDIMGTLIVGFTSHVTIGLASLIPLGLVAVCSQSMFLAFLFILFMLSVLLAHTCDWSALYAGQVRVNEGLGPIGRTIHGPIVQGIGGFCSLEAHVTAGMTHCYLHALACVVSIVKLLGLSVWLPFIFSLIVAIVPFTIGSIVSLIGKAVPWWMRGECICLLWLVCFFYVLGLTTKRYVVWSNFNIFLYQFR